MKAQWKENGINPLGCDEVKTKKKLQDAVGVCVGEGEPQLKETSGRSVANSIFEEIISNDVWVQHSDCTGSLAKL